MDDDGELIPKPISLFGLPDSLELKTGDLEQQTISSSYAPSESDCSALVDLKRRVRELDGILNEMQDGSVNGNNRYELGLGDNSDESDEDNDSVEGLFQIEADTNENDLLPHYAIESPDAGPESSSSSSVPPKAEAVDMVHSLSALFLRQNITTLSTSNIMKPSFEVQPDRPEEVISDDDEETQPAIYELPKILLSGTASETDDSTPHQCEEDLSEITSRNSNGTTNEDGDSKELSRSRRLLILVAIAAIAVIIGYITLRMKTK